MLDEVVQPIQSGQRQKHHRTEHLGGQGAASHPKEHVQRVSGVAQGGGRGDETHHGNHEGQPQEHVEPLTQGNGRAAPQHGKPHADERNHARRRQRREQHERNLAERGIES